MRQLRRCNPLFFGRRRAGLSTSFLLLRNNNSSGHTQQTWRVASLHTHSAAGSELARLLQVSAPKLPCYDAVRYRVFLRPRGSAVRDEARRRRAVSVEMSVEAPQAPTGAGAGAELPSHPAWYARPHRFRPCARRPSDDGTLPGTRRSRTAHNT